MAKTIVLIDDEADILDVVRFRLIGMGYKVLTAENGQEGLELVKDKKPDLVLLDFKMPLMDGEEVCKRIKGDEKLKHIPVILLTANSEGMSLEEIRLIGADAAVIKPFDMEKLLVKVKKIIEGGSHDQKNPYRG